MKKYQIMLFNRIVGSVQFLFYFIIIILYAYFVQMFKNSPFTLLKLQTVQEPSHYNTREFVSEITAKPSNKKIYRTQIKKSLL